MLIRRRRHPRPKRSPFSWRQLAFEVVVVVLGVTLALGANELRQRVADERRVEAATASIAAELAQNCRRLEHARTYHERLKAEADSVGAAGASVLDGSAEEAFGAIPSWQGYNPAFITSSAYETARATGALELMPYDLALELGNYYTFVDLYQETVRDAVGTVMMSGDPSFAQVAMALQVTLEAERLPGPQSCTSAEQLGAEVAERAETPPDTAAATS